MSLQGETAMILDDYMLVENDSIEISNVKGFVKDDKIRIKDLPDVILTGRPIELQFVKFDDDGCGHRSAYGHHWQLSFDFHVHHHSSSITGKMHNHDYWELIIAAAGSLEMLIESKNYKLNEGDACLLNRATRHAEQFQPGQTVIYIILSLEYIDTWPRHTDIAFKNPVLRLFENGINLPYYQNKDFIIAKSKEKDSFHPIFNLINSIKEEFLHRLPGNEYLVRGYVFRLLSLLTTSEHYDAVYHDFKGNHEFGLAYSAKQILDANKHRITLFELEGIMQYNGAYINQLFKKRYHCTINEYNQNVCLQHMAKLLLTTNYTVEQICHMIGFVNRTYVYQLFKETYGCTPSEFRKRK